jgi:hypothetical protein
VTLVNGAGFETLEPLLHARSRRSRDGILARLDRPHVDGNVALQPNTELAGAPRHPGRIGAGHQRLGRDAAGIHASAAERLALDDGDLHADLYQARGQRRSRLSGPDDDRVELLHVPTSQFNVHPGSAGESRLIP